MLEHVSPLRSSQAGAAARTTGIDGPPNVSAPTTTTSTRFQALLDRLQASANEVEAHADAPGDAKDLSKAVESAQQSLEDALTLKDELLEAFRLSQKLKQSA